MPADAAHSGAWVRRDRPAPGWILPLLATGGVLVAAAKLLGGPLALPLLAIVLVGAGLVLAAWLFVTGSRIGRGREAAWATAGVLVFLGFAAALLADGHEAMTQLDRIAGSIASASN